MTTTDLLLATVAAVGAGAVNALAGGGTLISFPVLIALGVPPIAANITNAVALCPGYFGATLAQARQLDGQRRRVTALLPAAIVGGLVGALLLVHTGERTFAALVPWMLTIASLLLAVQEPVRAMVLRRSADGAEAGRADLLAILAVLAASIYGGFFSAGMSVLLMAVLGLTSFESFTRLNALKQILAFAVNVAAVVLFLGSGRVLWSVAALMAIGALVGGALGGRLAGWMKPAVLRWIVVATGAVLAVVYWIKGA